MVNSRHDPNPDAQHRILEAAHRVFVRSGTAGARMQEIADEAGVNKALLHYYFRSKEKLAEAVFMQAAQRLMPPVFAVLASDLEIEEKVERVIQHELERLTETPYLPAYVLSEINHHAERAGQLFTSMLGMSPTGAGAQVFAKLGQQIDARVRAGKMRAIPPEQFAINLLSLCIFPFAAKPMLAALLGLDEAGFRAFIDRRKQELPEFFLAALRP